MARDIERVLGLAQRVLNLRRAAESPEGALAYVRMQLDEAEAALEAGQTTTRRADLPNGHGSPSGAAPAPKPGTPRNGSPRKASTRAGTERNGMTERVLAAFADGREHTNTELRDRLDLSAQQVKKCLGRLRKRDLIRSTGPGSHVRKGPVPKTRR